MDRGLGSGRVLCLVDSRVVLGPVCKGRFSSRRVNFRLRRLGGRSICVGCPLGQIPATHHRVSARSASGGPLSRCFLNRCTSPQKLFLKLRSKLTDCSSHKAKTPEPVYNACEKNKGIPSNIVTESSEPAEETKSAFDKRNRRTCSVSTRRGMI